MGCRWSATASTGLLVCVIVQLFCFKGLVQILWSHTVTQTNWPIKAAADQKLCSMCWNYWFCQWSLVEQKQMISGLYNRAITIISDNCELVIHSKIYLGSHVFHFYARGLAQYTWLLNKELDMLFVTDHSVERVSCPSKPWKCSNWQPTLSMQKINTLLFPKPVASEIRGYDGWWRWLQV